MQEILAVLFVFGLLGGAVWALRTKGGNFHRFKTVSRSLVTVERVALTPQHSLHLVRLGERTLLVAAHPGGCTLLDRDPER